MGAGTDGRGRWRQDAKKCVDFHSWKHERSTIEDGMIVHYAHCRDCGVSQRKFVRKVPKRKESIYADAGS